MSGHETKVQGIWVPLPLFLYVNDLASKSGILPFIFADDVKVLGASNPEGMAIDIKKWPTGLGSWICQQIKTKVIC